MWIVIEWWESYVSIADFLFTPSVQRVLGAVLLHPEQSYSLQDLLKVANTGRGSTQLQIDRLVRAGVLRDDRRGRQRSIRADTTFALYPELASIARKSFAMSEPITKALEPFGDQISEAFLFGSVAKGTDTQSSDIDLMIIGSAPLLELSEAVYQVEQSLGRQIHFSLYEPVEWRSLVQNDPVVAQLAAGPKIMLIEHVATI